MWIKTQYCNPNSRHLPNRAFCLAPLNLGYFYCYPHNQPVFVILFSFSSFLYIVPSLLLSPLKQSSFFFSFFFFLQEQFISSSQIARKTIVPHQCALSDVLVLSWFTSRSAFYFPDLFHHAAAMQGIREWSRQ